MEVPKRSPTKLIVWVLALLLIVALAFEGHRLRAWLPQAEHWIESLGVWGPIVFIAAVIVLEPFFVPSSLMGITAGVAFGLWKGYLVYIAAVYVASLLVYVLGRRLLRRPVLHLLDRRRSVSQAVAAAKRDGARLVFWIRLLPLNPAIFSYAFGALKVPFRAFALGNLGMFPGMFFDVYLGTMAAHVTKMAGDGRSWAARDVGLALGLVVAGLVSWQVARIARAQIQAAGITEAP